MSWNPKRDPITSLSTPWPPQPVYRDAVQVFQPYLRLRNAERVTAGTILTVLFAAAKINPLSDTCRILRGAPTSTAE